MLNITEIENQLLKEQNGFIFKTKDEQTGRLILNSIVLNDNDKISEINGSLFNLKIETKHTAES